MLLALLLSIFLHLLSAAASKFNNLFREVLYSLNTLFLLGFKTLFTIPVLGVAVTALRSSTSTQLGLGVLTGGLLLVQTVLYQLFTISQNPFSRIPFAGVSFSYELSRILLKVFCVLYHVLDPGLTHFGTFVPLNLPLLIIKTLLFLLCDKPFDWLVEKAYSFCALLYIWTSIFCTLAFYSGQFPAASAFLEAVIVAGSMLSLQSFLNARSSRLLLGEVGPSTVQGHMQVLVESIRNKDRFTMSRYRLHLYIEAHKRKCQVQGCECHGLWIDSPLRRWYKLVDRQIEEYAATQSVCFGVLMLQALVQLECLENKFKALFCVEKAKELAVTAPEHMAVFSLRSDISLIIESKDRSRVVPAHRFMQFQFKLEAFEDTLLTAVVEHINFWNEVADSSPKAEKVQAAVRRVVSLYKQLDEEFEGLSRINLNNYYLLRLYGNYLKTAQGKLKKGNHLLNRALIAERTSLIQKLNIYDVTHSKYGENSETIVVIISGNQADTGTITNCSRLVQRLGFQKKELVGQSVNRIMPKVVAERHDGIIHAFVENNAEKYSFEERSLVVLSKENYITPATVMSKVVPLIVDGLQIAGFVKEEAFDQQEQGDILYLLASRYDDTVYGVSRKCAEYFGISNEGFIEGGGAGNLRLSKLMGANIFISSLAKQLEGQNGLTLNVNLKELESKLKAKSVRLKVNLIWKRKFFEHTLVLLKVRLEGREKTLLLPLAAVGESVQPEEPYQGRSKAEYQFGENEQAPWVFTATKWSGIGLILALLLFECGCFYVGLRQVSFSKDCYSDFESYFNTSRIEAITLETAAELMAGSEAGSNAWLLALNRESANKINSLTKAVLRLTQPAHQYFDGTSASDNKTYFALVYDFSSACRSFLEFFQLGFKQQYTIAYLILKYNGLPALLNWRIFDIQGGLHDEYRRVLHLSPTREVLLVLGLLLLGLLVVGLLLLVYNFNRVNLVVLSPFLCLDSEMIKEIVTARKRIIPIPEEMLEVRSAPNLSSLQSHHQGRIQRHITHEQDGHQYRTKQVVLTFVFALAMVVIFAVNYWLLINDEEEALRLYSQYALLYNRTILCHSIRAAALDKITPTPHLTDVTPAWFVSLLYANENLMSGLQWQTTSALAQRLADQSWLCQRFNCTEYPVLKEGLRKSIFYFSRLDQTSPEAKRLLKVLGDAQEQLTRAVGDSNLAMIEEHRVHVGVLFMAAVLLLLCYGLGVWLPGIVDSRQKFFQLKEMLNLIPPKFIQASRALQAQFNKPQLKILLQ